jgi:hypothetical protein
MAVAQQLILKVLKSQFQAQEERYPGYREEAVTRFRVIMQIVRHSTGTQVRDKVYVELQDFGDTLGRKLGTDETLDGISEVKS